MSTTHHFMGTKLLSNGGFVAHVFVCKVAPESVDGD